MAGVDTVTALLEAKADVNARNKLGMTALAEAAVVRGRRDVAAVLVSVGGAKPAEERVNGRGLHSSTSQLNPSCFGQ
jgi:ankyrin repeat protein